MKFKENRIKKQTIRSSDVKNMFLEVRKQDHIHRSIAGILATKREKDGSRGVQRALVEQRGWPSKWD